MSVLIGRVTRNAAKESKVLSGTTNIGDFVSYVNNGADATNIPAYLDQGSEVSVATIADTYLSACKIDVDKFILIYLGTSKEIRGKVAICTTGVPVYGAEYVIVPASGTIYLSKIVSCQLGVNRVVISYSSNNSSLATTDTRIIGVNISGTVITPGAAPYVVSGSNGTYPATAYLDAVDTGRVVVAMQSNSSGPMAYSFSISATNVISYLSVAGPLPGGITNITDYQMGVYSVTKSSANAVYITYCGTAASSASCFCTLGSPTITVTSGTSFTRSAPYAWIIGAGSVSLGKFVVITNLGILLTNGSSKGNVVSVPCYSNGSVATINAGMVAVAYNKSNLFYIELYTVSGLTLKLYRTIYAPGNDPIYAGGMIISIKDLSLIYAFDRYVGGQTLFVRNLQMPKKFGVMVEDGTAGEVKAALTHVNT